jgi:predicted lipid-binding transport protein (Tim44 family)
MLSLAPALSRLWPRRVPVQAAALPRGLDVDEFLRLARLSFVRLQAAWDAADMDALAHLTTGPLLADLREQLEARGGAFNRTEVLDLQARLLAFEDLSDAFVASVEFSGLIRESIEAQPAEFRELWMLTRLKPSATETWQLARVQALA